jgi:hypothetical protein
MKLHNAKTTQRQKQWQLLNHKGTYIYKLYKNVVIMSELGVIRNSLLKSFYN